MGPSGAGKTCLVDLLTLTDAGGGGESVGRGLHSFTFQLNLSRACHKKSPCTPLTPPHTLNTGYTTLTRTPYPIQSAQVELKSGRV